MGGGLWSWALVSPDVVAPSRMVNVSASVNLSLHHKVQRFFSGWHRLTQVVRKRAVKRLCGGGGVLCSIVCNSGAQCNAHTLTDLTVVCWLDLAFCNYIVCYSLSVLDLGLFCVIVYLCMCAFVVLASVSSVLCQEIG